VFRAGKQEIKASADRSSPKPKEAGARPKHSAVRVSNGWGQSAFSAKEVVARAASSCSTVVIAPGGE